MSSSTLVNNTASNPIGVAQSMCRFPVMLNDAGATELEQAARILIRAGQRKALETVIQSDGVTASVKGIIARAMDQSKQRHLH